MRMKVPCSSGNGYYGHEIVIYVSDSASSSSSEDLDLDSPDSDFSEYLWMEHEEEFEKEVMQQLEEEELTEQCLEDMREDEQDLRNLHNSQPPCLELALQALRVQDPQLVAARQSTLNPNAEEFVPQRPQPTEAS